MKLILEKLGNRVHDKIGPATSTWCWSVATPSTRTGDGFTPINESQGLQGCACSLGIEIATLNKVRDFLDAGRRLDHRSYRVRQPFGNREVSGLRAVNRLPKACLTPYGRYS